MSTGISAVRPDTTLVEAAQQMRTSGVGGIPVLNPEGDCAGILTERDIVVRVLAEEREPLARRLVIGGRSRGEVSGHLG